MKKNAEKVAEYTSELKKTDAYKVAGFITSLIFIVGLVCKEIFGQTLPPLTLDDYRNHLFFSLSMSAISILFYYRIKNDKFGLWPDVFFYALILIAGELLNGLFHGFELWNQERHVFSQTGGFSFGGFLVGVFFGIFSVNIQHFGWGPVLTSTVVGLLGPWLLFSWFIGTIEKLTPKKE